MKFILPVTLFWTFCCLAIAEVGKTVHWPQFRGPGASGIAEGFETPTSWDADAGSNLKWKVPIPGLGHSCPVVWGDRIFLTTAISDKKKDSLKIGIYHEIAPVENDGVHLWKLYCIDKATGKILWERVCHKGVPKDKRHSKSSHANCTPATDGKRV
ncbi:MAG: hypothetical protein VCA36_12280, partial [Opitutales bacterium]